MATDVKVSQCFILIIQIRNIDLFPKQKKNLCTFSMKAVCPLFLIAGIWKKKFKTTNKEEKNMVSSKQVKRKKIFK